MSTKGKSSIGVCLVKLLSDFGLVTDFDSSSADKLVLGVVSDDDDAGIIPVAFITRKDKDTRDFIIKNQLVFSYNHDSIILSENIMLHDLLMKILKLFGWILHDVCTEPGETDKSYTRVSSAIAPKTHNVILILSDYNDKYITESRLVYCNKTLVRISILDTQVVINIPSNSAGITVDCNIKVLNK